MGGPAIHRVGMLRIPYQDKQALAVSELAALSAVAEQQQEAEAASDTPEEMLMDMVPEGPALAVTTLRVLVRQELAVMALQVF